MSRRGDWIQTFGGHRFWPLDPHVDEVYIEDIAHSLSMQCRFGGHTAVFYSVAQHSVLVSDLCSPTLKLHGLLHDAAEAYFIDMPRPIKRHPSVRRVIQPIEERLTRIIGKAFGIDQEGFYHPKVKEADLILLATEARDFMHVTPNGGEAWGIEDPMPKSIHAWTPAQARAAFLKTFNELRA